jgi:hypothetical protein
MLRLVFACALLCVATFSVAGTNDQTGKISNVSFETDRVLIKLDSGLPQWCAGTPDGWMSIPPSYKSIQALVLGMWLRGDLASTDVTVYVMPYNNSTYCQINQIDPAG